MAAAAMVATAPSSQAGYQANTAGNFIMKLESGSDTLTLDLTTNGAPTVISGTIGGNAVTPGPLASSFFQSYVGGAHSSSFNFTDPDNPVGLAFAGYTIQTQIANNNVGNPGTPPTGKLTISDTTVTNVSAGLNGLTITVSASGYNSPDKPRTFTSARTLNSLQAAGTNFTVKESSYYAEGDGDFDESGTVLGTTFQVTNGNSDGGTAFSNTNQQITNDYTLTNVIDITGLAQGSTADGINISAQVTAPAPAGLVLFATAVPFFGLLRRRMKAAPTV